MDHTRFVGHSPCPKCGSRDNLGTWDDGHSWCFGCGYYVPSREDIDRLKKKLNEYEPQYARDVPTRGLDKDAEGPNFTPIFDSFSFDLPDIVVRWLKKYGITDTEIRHYQLRWNKNTRSLAFPSVRDGKIVYYQERYFGDDPKHPKYITYGAKHLNTLVIHQERNPDQLVMVEDFISAIKVGRVVTASALLGSKISASTLKSIAEGYKRVRVWLDRDKAVDALLEASKLFGRVSDLRTIITPLDPKEYTTERITHELIQSGLVIKA